MNTQSEAPSTAVAARLVLEDLAYLGRTPTAEEPDPLAALAQALSNAAELTARLGQPAVGTLYAHLGVLALAVRTDLNSEGA